MCACLVCNRSLPIKSPKQQDGRTTSSSSAQNLLCEACKKFHWRYHVRGFKDRSCVCCEDVSANSITSCDAIVRCKPCRLQRCREIIESNGGCLTPPATKRQCRQKLPESNSTDQVPCTVCGMPSSGHFYGVVSCHSCKSFFRRNAAVASTFICPVAISNNGILCSNLSKCRPCRLSRCLSNGMSLKANYDGKRRYDETFDSTADGAEQFYWQQQNESGIGSTSPSEMNSEEQPLSGEISCLTNASSEFLFVEIPPSATPAIIYDSLINTTFEASEWLIDKTVQAALSLAPIAKIKVVITSDMARDEMATLKCEAFTSYLKCVSEFFKQLPGMLDLAVEDRISIYLRSFLPVLAAELSLSFDVANQEPPNHLSLCRNGACASTELSHLAHIGEYLREVGNRMLATVTDIKEFSLLCALLCLFNPGNQTTPGCIYIAQIGSRYKLALSHHLEANGHSADRFTQFLTLLSSLHRATEVFRLYILDLLDWSLQCRDRDSAVGSLLKDFCQQFMFQCAPVTN